MTKLSSRNYAEILMVIEEKLHNYEEMDKILDKMIVMLAERKQLNLLPMIINHYQLMSQEKKQELKVKITTTDGQISEKNWQKIKSFLKKYYPSIKKIDYELLPIDKNLIGGMILQINDEEWDLSLINQIHDFSCQLLKD